MKTSKFYIAVAIIGVYLTIYPVLFAQDNIFPYILKNTASDAHHSVEISYLNLYCRKAQDKPDGFADILYYKLGSQVKVANQIFDVNYAKHRFRAKLKAMSNQTDWMDLTSVNEYLSITGDWQLTHYDIKGRIFLSNYPGFYLGLSSHGKTQFVAGAGISKSDADISYNVKDIDGTIPFNWYRINADCALEQADDYFRCNYFFTIPAKPEAKYDNKIYVNDVSVSASKQVHNKITFNGYANYVNIYAKFDYKQLQYAKLDNLHSIYSALSVNFTPGTDFSYDFGSKIYISRIGTDSYFDIWPFTFWDMFLAHRTRIKEADINSISPYLAINFSREYLLAKNPLSINASIEYNHLLHNSSIIIKNRRIVFYPFLFAYDTDYYEIDDDTDGIFILPVKLSYQIWGIETGIRFEQMLPIDWNYFQKKPHSHTSSDRKIRESGGTYLGLYITLPI